MLIIINMFGIFTCDMGIIGGFYPEWFPGDYVRILFCEELYELGIIRVILGRKQNKQGNLRERN